MLTTLTNMVKCKLDSVLLHSEHSLPGRVKQNSSFKICLLGLIFLLAGCSTKGVNATLFLKEKDQFLTNLEGGACLESGQQIITAPDGTHYRMVHYYSNCNVHLNRRMEDFEPRQWGLPEKPRK